MKRVVEASGPAGFLASLAALVLATNVGVAYATAKITTKQIADDAITSQKIRDGQVRNPDLANGAVTSAEVKDGSLAASDFSASTRALLTGEPGPQGPPGPPGGPVEDGSILTSMLADFAVTDAKIQGSSIGEFHLQDFAVTRDKIADGAVTDLAIAIGAVDTPHLADGSVTTSKIAPGAVTGLRVADDSLKGADIDESSLDLSPFACDRGAIRGFARVDGAALPLDQWTTLPQPAYNCTGNPVLAYRGSTGKVVVYFVGLNSLYASVSSLGDWTESPNFSIPGDGGFQTATVTPEVYMVRVDGNPGFYVQTRFGDNFRNGPFTLVAY